jgi:hypothetical protein
MTPWMVVMLVLAARLASAACLPDVEPWTVIAEGRTVACCAVHGIGGRPSAYWQDTVTLWCPQLRPRRRALFVSMSIDASDFDFEHGALYADRARACRQGPHFRRAPTGKRPWHVRPFRRCCQLAVDSLTTTGSRQRGLRLAGFDGRIQCRRHATSLAAFPARLVQRSRTASTGNDDWAAPGDPLPGRARPGRRPGRPTPARRPADPPTARRPLGRATARRTLSLLGGAALGAPCRPGTDTWVGTIGRRAVSCCVSRDFAGGTAAYDFDSVVLWCRPRTARPSLFAVLATDPITGQPTARFARVCRQGPRLRHVCRRRRCAKRHPSPHQRACCALVITAVTGPVAPQDSATGAFIPLGTAHVTGFRGDIACRHRTIPIALALPPD